MPSLAPPAVPPALAGLLGLASEQTWRDRVREGAYTSPSNTRIVFQFEDVERKTPLLGTKFNFPGVNNAYIQRTGFDSREYPIRAYFTGAQHDKIATAFEAAVLETGLGRLDHPLYGGNIKVIAFGEITRRNDLVKEANQSIVETTFVTSVDAIYPSSRPSGANEILAAIAGFDVKAAQSFSDGMDLISAAKRARAKASLRSMLKDVSSALKSVSDQVASVNREFRDLQASVNLGIDVLIGQPLLLARQVCDLVKAPARALAGIESRLDGYARLAGSIFGSSAGNPAKALASGTSIGERVGSIGNDLRLSDLVVTNAVAGSILAAAQPGSFDTRPQAIIAAIAIQEQLDNAVLWRDAGFAALGTVPAVSATQVDTGEAIEALQAAAAMASGFLVQTSFGLVPERRIAVDRNRTIIDLAAEVYGSVDNRLDQLIVANKLTGDEILELPQGKIITYFPDA
jgi:hypothetical protein